MLYSFPEWEATMAKSLTIQDLMKMFPDDDGVPWRIFSSIGMAQNVDVPQRCGEVGKFRKLVADAGLYLQLRRSTSIRWSGRRSAGRRVPLQKWFYAMYLFTTITSRRPGKGTGTPAWRALRDGVAHGA